MWADAELIERNVELMRSLCRRSSTDDSYQCLSVVDSDSDRLDRATCAMPEQDTSKTSAPPMLVLTSRLSEASKVHLRAMVALGTSNSPFGDGDRQHQ